MAKNDNQNLKKELAKSINDLGLATGANADEVIDKWRSRNHDIDLNASLQQVVPVIQSFTTKIAEMVFEDRHSAYKGKFKGVIDSMYDKDLVYGYGREYNLPNFIPIKDFDVNVFNPTQVTTPVNTTSVISVDEPKQMALTLQPELYHQVVTNGGNLDNFVATLKTTMNASLDCYMENKIVEEYLLARTTDANSGNLAYGTTITVPTDKTSKYTDTASRNMKECFNILTWLISKMTTVATNHFNIAGSGCNGFFASDESDIVILCTNKFLANVQYGMQLGLYKPELINNILNKLVPLPDHKVIPPAATNTTATLGAWTNAINDNTLLIINKAHSFKFGKQFKNTSSQFYAKNMAIEITTNYLPYFGYLKDGQMLIYTSANLNTLPGNVMANI